MRLGDDKKAMKKRKNKTQTSAHIGLNLLEETTILGYWEQQDILTRYSQLFYFLMLAIPFTFFIMWELELILRRRRLYSATKFILYTTGGFIFFLIGVLGMGLYGSNEPRLDLERLINQSYPITLEILLYFGLFIAYLLQIKIQREVCVSLC
ncbi:hypothetical protein ACJX0J_013999 [Zea mays]